MTLPRTIIRVLVAVLLSSFALATCADPAPPAPGFRYFDPLP